MYDISVDNPNEREFRVYAANAKFKYNYPLIAVLAVNILAYLYTLWVPSAMMDMALYPQQLDWGVVTFNFTHASFLHILFNMLGCFLFARDIQTHFRNNRMYQWLVYFGFAPVIGLIVGMMTSNPVVGYSGVVSALIGLAVALNFHGSRIVLIQVVIFHIILILMPNNVSILTHAVGFVVGYAFGIFTTKQKPSLPKPKRSWRERHGIM